MKLSEDAQPNKAYWEGRSAFYEEAGGAAWASSAPFWRWPAEEIWKARKRA